MVVTNVYTKIATNVYIYIYKGSYKYIYKDSYKGIYKDSYKDNGKLVLCGRMSELHGPHVQMVFPFPHTGKREKYPFQTHQLMITNLQTIRGKIRELHQQHVQKWFSHIKGKGYDWLMGYHPARLQQTVTFKTDEHILIHYKTDLLTKPHISAPPAPKHMQQLTQITQNHALTNTHNHTHKQTNKGLPPPSLKTNTFTSTHLGKCKWAPAWLGMPHIAALSLQPPLCTLPLPPHQLRPH